MADDRPLILCANDDGIFSKGLKAIADALSSFARVVVVAPETEQSATSHSLTLHRPLRLRRVEPDRYALDGTPADCVYLALHLSASEASPAVLPRRPDLVVSGINKGINLGQDVFYSGTVAAAREGALRRIPSIALSCAVVADESGVYTFDPSHAATLGVELARALMDSTHDGILLNVNVPRGPVQELVATKLGNRLWSETVEARVDPRGRPYFWLGGRGVEHAQIAGTDTAAFDAGLASVTALNLDLARHDEKARACVEGIVKRLRT